MKALLLLLTISLGIQLSAQDTTLYQYKDIALSVNKQSKRYTYKTANKTFTNLLFAKRIFKYHQVLDQDLNLFFIAEDGSIKDSVQDFLPVCGTVPHYELRVRKKGKFWEVTEDETWYDREGKEGPKVVERIPLKDADSVVFLNGRSDFNYTSNFSVLDKAVHPRIMLIAKNGKFKTLDQKKTFAQIDFSEYYNGLIISNKNKFGFLNLSEPKFTKVNHFNYYLAQVQLANGTLAFMDTDGMVYHK